MAAFADQLHDLVQAEASRAMDCPKASSAMTREMAGALANSIALLSFGQIGVAKALTDEVVGALPQMILRKTFAVRDGLAEMEAGR